MFIYGEAAISAKAILFAESEFNIWLARVNKQRISRPPITLLDCGDYPAPPYDAWMLGKNNEFR